MNKLLVTEEGVSEWMAKNGKSGFVTDYQREAQLQAVSDHLGSEEVKGEIIKVCMPDYALIAPCECPVCVGKANTRYQAILKIMAVG